MGQAARCPLFEVTLTIILLPGCSPSAQDHGIGSDFNTSASDEPSVTHVHAALPEGKRRLEAAGFPPQLAEKLVAVNELLLRISYEEDQSECDSILAHLSRLGRHDHLRAQLEKFPELAGLCASALGVDPSGPALILASVPAVKAEQEVVYSMYSFFCDETDALRLAPARTVWTGHESSMVRGPNLRGAISEALSSSRGRRGG